MNASGRSSYEVLIVTVVVLLSGLLAIGLYVERSKVEKGRMLIDELAALRTSVALYAIANRQAPPSLEALVEETYESGDGTQHAYVADVYRNRRGDIVDPFGNVYAYDPLQGWVYSETEGYDAW